MFKKIIAAELLTLILFLIGVFIGVELFKKPINVTNTNNSFAIVSPKPINNNNPQKGIYNALLLGYGGAGHEGSLLTDSIIVIHVDTNTHKATLISIPRDLWIPGSTKINAAGINGFQNMMPAVTNVTGLPINYFVAVDFGNYMKLIDNLGGITVNVPKTFDDPFYPITGEESNTCGFTENQIFEFKNKYQGFQLESQFTCRYEHLHFDKGEKTLDGITALKYVRSRHGDSDFGRSERQFSVLEGISNKLISLRSLNKLNDTVGILFNMVKSDLDLGTIKSLSEVFGDPGLYKINKITLSTENVLTESFASDGEYILTPRTGMFDYGAVKTYINSNL